MNKVYGYCRTARAEGNDINEQIKLISNYCKTKELDLCIANLYGRHEEQRC